VSDNIEPCLSPVRFRGGVGSGFGGASWPFGKCRFTAERIEVRGPFATARASRDQVKRVIISRRRFRSVRLTIQRWDGTTLTPTFLPARTGELIDALREHHWPIEVEVFKPRLPPAVWIALACAIVIGAGVEASLKSARSDRLTRGSLTTKAVITSMTNEGGKQRAFASYAAGPTTFTTSLIISWDKHTGDTLTLHYLPESPQKSWEQGSDPPGTDEWWLGPVVPLAIMLGARSIQVRTLRQRLVEPAGSDTTLRS
jgi:hypothetical protein